MPTKKKRAGAKPADKKAIVAAGDAPASPPAPAVTDPNLPPVERDALGRWVRGQSGNAQGKPKGLRNYVTRERLALEAALRSYISQDANMSKVLDGIDRMFSIMQTGEDKDAIAAWKALADKLLTAPKDTGDGNDGPNQLTVVITQAHGGDAPPIRVIEGEFSHEDHDE